VGLQARSSVLSTNEDADLEVRAPMTPGFSQAWS
jgi:hypothetical protein